jgi:prevent-host-death family protein
LTPQVSYAIIVIILVDQKGGHIMKTLSLSEAKMKLSSLVDAVSNTDEEVVITKNGSPAAVLVSPDEFESWKETVSVRSDAALMSEIKKGLKALKSRKARLYTLEELFR